MPDGSKRKEPSFAPGFCPNSDSAEEQSYAGVYFIRRQWVGASIARKGLDSIEMRFNNEFGLSFGADPKIKLWFITLPRIGIGYRWGPHVNGFA
jgi:hypothetical protein